jgi:hypothetical protein
MDEMTVTDCACVAGPNASSSCNYSVDLNSLHHNLIVDMPLELETGC